MISQQGLQFFKDREKSAQEVHRVLKPGGRFVANVWQGTDVHTLWGDLFEGVASHLNAPLKEVSLPFMMGDPAVLKSYVESGGFSGVDVTVQNLTLRYPQPERMVQLAVAAAAASIPAFGAMSPEQRAAVAKEVADSLSDRVKPYVKGDFVEMESATNIAVAKK